MNLLGTLHNKLVFQGRVHVLASAIEKLLPANSKVLDVGCGDGFLSHLITKKRKDLHIIGIDILKREKSYIEMNVFNGKNIPFEKNKFDAVIFVDVLHHTTEPDQLIKEAKRVSRQSIIIKDHTAESTLDILTLKFMDWLGNAPHGVTLPYNYLSSSDWNKLMQKYNLKVEYFNEDIPLYMWPASIFFTRSLHFVSKLKI